jgi:hypothetical protein
VGVRAVMVRVGRLRIMQDGYLVGAPGPFLIYALWTSTKPDLTVHVAFLAPVGDVLWCPDWLGAATHLALQDCGTPGLVVWREPIYRPVFPDTVLGIRVGWIRDQVGAVTR